MRKKKTFGATTTNSGKVAQKNNYYEQKKTINRTNRTKYLVQLLMRKFGALAQKEIWCNYH